MKLAFVNVFLHWTLSTPHGALGTGGNHRGRERFNLLSTPHGALGTLSSKLR
jgi:hypothetical protein